jgi:hypothetical protein
MIRHESCHLETRRVRNRGTFGQRVLASARELECRRTASGQRCCNSGYWQVSNYLVRFLLDGLTGPEPLEDARQANRKATQRG